MSVRHIVVVAWERWSDGDEEDTTAQLAFLDYCRERDWIDEGWHADAQNWIEFGGPAWFGPALRAKFR